MAISSVFWFFLLLLAYGYVAVCGQSGFISIDSGKPGNYSYYDNVTGLLYTSDEDYIHYDTVGEVHNVSSEYHGSSPHSHSDDLRSFPNSNRNCYTLKPLLPGTRYLVRAFFLYGNYDGLNRPPKFDIYIDIHLWDTIQISSASVYQHSEILVVATGESMLLCLTNTGSGTPFVSAIDARPLDKEMYVEANTSQSLVTVYRLDFGGKYQLPLRYRTDTYDRLWTSYNQPEWTMISTTSPIDISVYRPPQEVMSTAAIPKNNNSMNINLRTRISYMPAQYYLFIYLAEIQLAASTQSRIIDIYVNDGKWKLNATINHFATTFFGDTKPATYDGLDISLRKANGSDFPPLVNGLEFYMVKNIEAIGTNSGDVDAIMQIKASYMMQKNWMGDPCSPKDFIWVGLRCSYAQNKAPRIISLALPFSGLTGNIPPCLEQLTELQYLDLSSNNLSGEVPSFLGNLPRLTFLNLSYNRLSGSLPKTLTDKSTSGKLVLRVEGNQINGGGGKRYSNVEIIVATTVAGLLVIVFLAVLIFRRRQKSPHLSHNDNHVQSLQRPIHSSFFQSFLSESRKFTYDELLRMTNNFEEIIGSGAFGTVYYGTIKDTIPVAVKILSQSSPQGTKQFQAEARLLSNIRHKNLLLLVGYCHDKDCIGLVYDYMAQGSLADHLSGKCDRNNALGWKDRLRISVEAAQGLQYLHEGCRPGIVHRDIKPSNILLNHNLEVKIGDFGLSRNFQNHEPITGTNPAGTPGYIPPECIYSTKPDIKSDVYSFGVVLMELITGLPAVVNREEGLRLVNWMKPKVDNRNLKEIMDYRLQDYNPNSVWMVIELAMACVSPTPASRPSMLEVLMKLKDCLGLENVEMESEKSSVKGTSASLELLPLSRNLVLPEAR